MKKYIITKHCSEERLARLTYIGTTVGFGENVLLEQYNPKTDHTERLMDNGLLLILDAHGEILITAFLIDFNRAYAMYKANNKDIPVSVKRYFLSNVYKKILSNAKKNC